MAARWDRSMNIGFDDNKGVQKFLAGVQETSDTAKKALALARVNAQFTRLLLTGVTDPLVLALNQIADILDNYIEDLFNSSVHTMIIGPHNIDLAEYPAVFSVGSDLSITRDDATPQIINNPFSSTPPTSEFLSEESAKNIYTELLYEATIFHSRITRGGSIDLDSDEFIASLQSLVRDSYKYRSINVQPDGSLTYISESGRVTIPGANFREFTPKRKVLPEYGLVRITPRDIFGFIGEAIRDENDLNSPAAKIYVRYEENTTVSFPDRTRLFAIDNQLLIENARLVGIRKQQEAAAADATVVIDFGTQIDEIVANIDVLDKAKETVPTIEKRVSIGDIRLNPGTGEPVTVTTRGLSEFAAYGAGLMIVGFPDPGSIDLRALEMIANLFNIDPLIDLTKDLYSIWARNFGSTYTQRFRRVAGVKEGESGIKRAQFREGDFLRGETSKQLCLVLSVEETLPDYNVVFHPETGISDQLATETDVNAVGELTNPSSNLRIQNLKLIPVYDYNDSHADVDTMPRDEMFFGDENVYKVSVGETKTTAAKDVNDIYVTSIAISGPVIFPEQLTGDILPPSTLPDFDARYSAINLLPEISRPIIGIVKTLTNALRSFAKSTEESADLILEKIDELIEYLTEVEEAIQDLLVIFRILKTFSDIGIYWLAWTGNGTNEFIAELQMAENPPPQTLEFCWAFMMMGTTADFNSLFGAATGAWEDYKDDYTALRERLELDSKSSVDAENQGTSKSTDYTSRFTLGAIAADAAAAATVTGAAILAVWELEILRANLGTELDEGYTSYQIFYVTEQRNELTGETEFIRLDTAPYRTFNVDPEADISNRSSGTTLQERRLEELTIEFTINYIQDIDPPSGTTHLEVVGVNSDGGSILKNRIFLFGDEPRTVPAVRVVRDENDLTNFVSSIPDLKLFGDLVITKESGIVRYSSYYGNAGNPSSQSPFLITEVDDTSNTDVRIHYGTSATTADIPPAILNGLTIPKDVSQILIYSSSMNGRGKTPFIINIASYSPPNSSGVDQLFVSDLNVNKGTVNAFVFAVNNERFEDLTQTYNMYKGSVQDISGASIFVKTSTTPITSWREDAYDRNFVQNVFRHQTFYVDSTGDIPITPGDTHFAVYQEARNASGFTFETLVPSIQILIEDVGGSPTVPPTLTWTDNFPIKDLVAGNLVMNVAANDLSSTHIAVWWATSSDILLDRDTGLSGNTRPIFALNTRSQSKVAIEFDVTNANPDAIREKFSSALQTVTLGSTTNPYSIPPSATKFIAYSIRDESALAIGGSNNNSNDRFTEFTFANSEFGAFVTVDIDDLAVPSRSGTLSINKT